MGSILLIVFGMLFLSIFWKMLILALKASWGLAKILCFLVFLPLSLVWMVFLGLLKIAFPVLLIVGLIMVARGR